MFLSTKHNKNLRMHLFLLLLIEFFNLKGQEITYKFSLEKNYDKVTSSEYLPVSFFSFYNPLAVALYHLNIIEHLEKSTLSPSSNNYLYANAPLTSLPSRPSSGHSFLAERRENFHLGIPNSAALSLRQQSDCLRIPLLQTEEDMRAFKAQAPYIPRSSNGKKRLIYIGKNYKYFYIMDTCSIQQQYQKFLAYQQCIQGSDSLIFQHQKRRLESLQHSNFDELSEQRSVFTEPTHKLIKDCHLKKWWKLTCIFGNSAQRSLHQEVCYILNQLGQLYSSAQGIYRTICKDLTSIVHIIMEAIWKGQLVYGYCIVDWCYSILMGLKEISSRVKHSLDQSYSGIVQLLDTTQKIDLINDCPLLVLAYYGLPFIWEFLKMAGHAASIVGKKLLDNKAATPQEWEDLMIQLQETYKALWYNGWHLEKDRWLNLLQFSSKLATQISIEHKLNRKFLKIFKYAKKALKKAAKHHYAKELTAVIFPSEKLNSATVV